VNHLWRNLVVNSGEFLRRNGGGARLLEPRGHERTSAFPDAVRGVFRFEEAAKLAARAGFQPPPFDEIGLYPDAYRRTVPTERIAALRAGQEAADDVQGALETRTWTRAEWCFDRPLGFRHSMGKTTWKNIITT